MNVVKGTRSHLEVLMDTHIMVIPLIYVVYVGKLYNTKFVLRQHTRTVYITMAKEYKYTACLSVFESY